MDVLFYRILTLLFHPICHQQPELLLRTGGRSLPLCDRCAGLYLALVSAALVIPLTRLRHTRRYPGALGNGFLALLAASAALDWLLVWLGAAPFNADRKFLSGLALGSTGAIYYHIFLTRAEGAVQWITDSAPSLPLLLVIVFAAMSFGALIRFTLSPDLIALALSVSLLWFFLRLHSLLIYLALPAFREARIKRRLGAAMVMFVELGFLALWK